MNTSGLITKIRNLIADGTNLALTSVYSPDLELGKNNICAVSVIAGNTNEAICDMNYYELTLRCLIRGNESDTDTRTLADSIFNALHRQSDVTFTSGKIINIFCQPPIFAFRDENGNNLYNITFNVKGE